MFFTKMQKIRGVKPTNTCFVVVRSFANIKLARDALCALIMGSEPGKVYNRLKTVSKRVQERL